jgi:hypothetical protein
MAVIAGLDSIDLWVEPHELTDEDREAYRGAMQELRNRPGVREISAEVARILASRRGSRPREDGPDSEGTGGPGDLDQSE